MLYCCKKESDSMKKIVSLLLSLFILLGCSSKEAVTTLEIEGIIEIEYEELIQNLNSNVRFLLYIGRPDCGDCQAFYPYLEEYIDEHEGTGIYYLNIKAFRDAAKAEDASDEEIEFYENLYTELDFDWTPTIHVVENGKFTVTYQYLDENYYEIEDREEQIQRKQEFLDEFEIFMDDYFKEA